MSGSIVQLKGVKLDNGKMRWSLLPLNVMACVVGVLEYGARKYSPDNWKLVDNHRTRYYDAAMRHLSKWQLGNINDRESKLPHLAHAICCLVFLLWFDLKNRKGHK